MCKFSKIYENVLKVIDTHMFKCQNCDMLSFYASLFKKYSCEVFRSDTFTIMRAKQIYEWKKYLGRVECTNFKKK